MSLGIGEILGIGASILGGRSGGGTGVSAPTIINMPKRYEYRETVDPEVAKTVEFGESSAQYVEFLQAWDSFLNNEYSEMAKRIMG
jgi:hypothetical protein